MLESYELIEASAGLKLTLSINAPNGLFLGKVAEGKRSLKDITMDMAANVSAVRTVLHFQPVEMGNPWLSFALSSPPSPPNPPLPRRLIW